MKHGFIGFGNMAKAIHKGLKKNKKNNFKYISKSSKYKDIELVSSINELVEFSDVIWLCVKPQIIPEILTKLANENFENKLIVSIIAGKKISFIESYLNNDVSIVRVMPNLAIEYGESVTAFCANCDNEIVHNVKTEIKKMGVIAEINEEDFDLFTALYGSGPAFILEVLDTFKFRTEELGVSEDKVNEMIINLLSGTKKYLEKNCYDNSIEELIKKITSKGGTTEAGLKTFKKNKISQSLSEVITSAKNRSEEL